MQKYLKVCLFIGVTIFTSDLLAQKKDDIRRCAKPLQFDLPEPLKKVGVSNIKVRNGLNRYHPALTDQFNLYEFYFYIREQLYEIEVAIERNLEPSLGTSDQVVLERLRQVLGELPTGIFQKNFSLVINRTQRIDKNGEFVLGEVTWTGRRIDLYSDVGLFTPPNRTQPNEYPFAVILNIMARELGHVIDMELDSSQVSFSISHSQKWKDAILADGHRVPEEGDTRLEEDFAMVMMAYVWSDGGLYYPEFLNGFSNRFAILDEVMGVTPLQRSQINEETDRADDLSRLSSSKVQRILESGQIFEALPLLFNRSSD